MIINISLHIYFPLPITELNIHSKNEDESAQYKYYENVGPTGYQAIL